MYHITGQVPIKFKGFLTIIISFFFLLLIYFNPIALRTAKTPQSFGCSECNRVNSFQEKIFEINIIVQF